MPTEDAAAYLASDLDQLFGEERLDEIVRFPASGLKPYDTDQVAEPAAQVQRSDVLQRLSEEDFQGILVTSAEALYETIPAPETLEENTYTLRVGEEIEPAALVNRLVDDQFSRVEYVQEPGDVARRGGIVDVYPFSGDYPVRIEFFGDEVDSIREFDPVSQRSISRRNSARLVPNLAAAAAVVGRGTLFDYLPEALHLFLYDADLVVEDIQARYDRAVSAFAELESDDPDAKSGGASPSSNVSRETSAPHLLYVDSQRFEGLLAPHPALIAGSFGRQRSGAEETLTFAAAPQPAVNGRIALIRERLQDNTAAGIDTWIVCDSRGQQSRLRELLDLDEPPVLDEDGFGEDGFGGDGTPSLADTYGGSFDVRLVVESLHEGFEAPVAGVAVYTDHQLFGRYHRPTRRKRAKQLGGLSLNELRNLKRGDFVVHIDYGIGRFDGMAKREVRGKEQEVVKVLYHGDDALYVNVNALHKLHKYTGKEGHQPRLTKLGSGAWERKKARTKKRVKDIARDLIKLYAARKSAKGFAFSEDSVWQREMEASFPYVDTPDQAASAEAVKDDMEQPIPMDRLVCGDVGFGKTEIAVRAAFKAVQDGKQVAVLVPTTILADQHFQTFSRRLGPYPVVVEVLSRFRTAEESRDVVKRLKEGKVDILIGTQRIVSKDVTFKDIGLLIVDEEQRFGVKAKEKLRKLRANVDTLTLTATPIPRTLQFSLLGARDLSIIRTPPPNRQPIVTEIHTYDT
ncbi:MAG: DEAD/DEAH box helicase, partial [Bacteroidota bacterium]